MTRWASCGLVVALVGAVGAQPPGPRPDAVGAPDGRPNTRPIRPVFTLPGAPKLDRHGDPLPAGAVARYGTVRLRHGTDVNGIGFTPDGKWLCTVSASEDSVKMWDPVSGKEVARLNVLPQLVALAKDGSVFVVDDSKIRVWLPATSTVRVLPEKTIPEGATPTAVAVNPDGRTFALAVEGKVLLIDSQSGKTTRELNLPGGPQNNPNGKGGAQPNGQPAPPPGPPPNRLVYSPDGRWLVGSGQKTGVWLWDLRTGKRVRTYRSELDSPEYAFSPDVTRIVVTGPQHLHLYALDSEEPVDGFKCPDHGPLFAPRFGADGKTLFAIQADGVVTEFDAATGEEGDSHEPPDANLHAPFALAPGGATAAGIDSSGGIRLWDPKTGKGPEVARLTMLTDPGFAADGKSVAVLDQTNKVHTFDPATGAPGKITELPGEDVGLPAHWDAGSRRAAVIVPSGDDLEMQVVDADTGKVVCKHTLAGGNGVPFVAFAAANRDRMALFGQNDVTVLNPTTGKVVRTFTLGAQDSGTRGAIAPDGRSVVAGTQPATIWEVATGKKRLTIDAIQIVGTFSPDSRFLCGWDDSGNVAVADARTGAVLRRFPTPGDGAMPGTLAFSPDGKRLAVGTGDGRVTVWDVPTGEVLAPFAGHDGFVSGMAFSADGKRLVSTAGDGTALVWDVPEKPLTAGPAETAVTGFEEAFRLLGSPDAAQAQRGLDYIYRHPADAAKQAGERVPVPVPAPTATVAKHIEDLASDEFPTREAAKKALAALAGEAGPALKRAAEKSPSAEVRKTAAELLNKIDAPAVRAEDLRVLRAVEAVENLRSAEGRAQLEKWAAGPPGHRLTVEAGAAVTRLKAQGGK